MSWPQKNNGPGWWAGAGALQVIASSALIVAHRDYIVGRCGGFAR